jgi:predicted SAM-dependent methyltransferase
MVNCPLCNWKGDEFLPFGVKPSKPRKNAMCPKCGSLERHRLYYLYLNLRKIIDPNKKLNVLHFAPENIITFAFRSFENINYLSADINPGSAMVKEDITNISFDDNSFDIVFCSHVLEHIEDDIKAMKEIHRILKPDGFAILQVPIADMDKTFEDFTITDPNEREKVFGQNDHVRIYGRDYKDRLIKSGFNVKIDKFIDDLGEHNVKRFALLNESIYFCTK